MSKTLFILLVFSGILTAQDEPETDKSAWAAWEKLEKVILENKEKESIALLSGRMKEGFFKFGMTSINTEVRAMNPKFIREFANKKNNTRFLTIDVNGELRTLMFIKSGKEWLFDEQVSESYTTSQDAEIGLGQFIAQQQLKKVYDFVVAYCSAKNIKRIPPPKEMELKKELLTYRNPSTGENSNILIVRNVDFIGNFNLLLAVTEDIIGASHQAVFEDAHMGSVSKENFDKHALVLGLESSDDSHLSDEQIIKFVKQLGAQKSKDRKDARNQLLKLDEGALKTLTGFKNSPELEIRLSIQEIIEAISKKSSIKRPKL